MSRLFFLLLLVSCTTFLNAQQISTILGNGTQGYNGDNGAGAQAEISAAARIAYDHGNGNIYVADKTNNCIRMLSESGIVSTLAGNGTGGFGGDNGLATEAELFNPASVIVGDSGNLYIADYGNSRVRKVTAAGIITTFAGNGTSGYNGDGGQAATAELKSPADLAIDKHGNLYIADRDADVVRKIAPSGIISTVAGTGTAGYNADNIAATTAKLNLPTGIAIDTSGNIYIADNGNNRIRRIDTAGIITTIAGTAGINTYNGDADPATAAGIGSPNGLGIDDSGNIYIAELTGNVIRKIDTAGIIITVSGNNTAGYNGDNIAATAAELNEPQDVKADKYGNLFVADNNNYRVRYVCDHSDSLLISVSVTPYDTILQGTPVLFTCTATGGGYALSYQWKKNGGNVGADINTYTDDTYATGDQIYCVVTSNSSCAINPTVLTDTTIMDVIGEAGIGNIAGNENISVYPNPFASHLTVKGIEAGDKLCLYDLAGRKLTTEQTVDGTQTESSFTIPNLAAGTYILQVVNGSGYKKIALPVIKQ